MPNQVARLGQSQRHVLVHPAQQTLKNLAAGVMLYQMLTGEVPRGAWHPPSVRVQGIDRRFDNIVVKAMQVDRNARHSSALDLRRHWNSLLMPTVPAPDLQPRMRPESKFHREVETAAWQRSPRRERRRLGATA